jgi:hypothetical protein
MKRLLCICLFCCIPWYAIGQATDSVQVRDELISDWRLDQPFKHGFFEGLTLGLVINNEPYRVATDSALISYSPLVAEHVIRHRTIPYYLGWSLSMTIWATLLYTVHLRIRLARQVRYAK